MIRNAQPLKWQPRGISDTLDATTSFPGAMAALVNLVPDPSTSGLWQCRPAAVPAVPVGTGGPFSSGFSSGFQIGILPGNIGTISVFHIVGNLLYGMIGSTLDGKDHPFAFNFATNSFMTVAIAPGADLPQSQPTTGPWTPPTMDVIGSKLMTTHPGFSSTASFIGWFDIATPTAPVWHSGNISGAITFSVVPSYVAQFSNRAYYIVNLTAQPAIVFSDPLSPLTVFAATQVLTFGDLVPLTALGQLRLYNQLGGIIQALIVFKDDVNTYQITGDAALNNLAVNSMNFAIGTKSPIGICSTPKGLAFIAPDGLRIIDFQANVSDPLGVDGKGVVVPFIYSNVPSRAVLACNGDTIRATVQNANANGNPFQEYWYHISRGIWSGPHSFPAALISGFANTFIMTGVGVTNAMYQSDVQQSSGSTFVENGAQLNWTYTTALLPDTDTMTNITIPQSTLDLALSATTPPIAVSALDQNMGVIDSIQIVGTGASAIWGSFNWGSAAWGSPLLAFAPRRLNWKVPLTASRIQFTANGQSASAIKVGALRLKYRILKYLTDIQAAA